MASSSQLSQVDRLNLDNYANLSIWVEALESRISSILASRLKAELDRWCTAFQQADRGEVAGDAGDHVMRSRLSFGSLVHEIRIRNQVLYVDPPLEHTRAIWSHSLEAVIGELFRCPAITYADARQQASFAIVDV